MITTHGTTHGFNTISIQQFRIFKYRNQFMNFHAQLVRKTECDRAIR